MKTSTELLRPLGLALLGLVFVVSAAGFSHILNSGTGLPIKWPEGNSATTPGNIAVTIMLGDSQTLSDGLTYNTSARAAAQIWNRLIGAVQIQTTFTTGSPKDANGVNEMGFSNTVFGRPFDPGVLAVTTGYRNSRNSNQRAESDIIFNGAETWNSYRDSQSAHGRVYDLQRVAVHELGHLLGLDHPDDNGQRVSAIMNSTISDITNPTADDIQGVTALYGPTGFPPNDAFARATSITLSTTGTVSVTGFNTQATKESNEPLHGDNSGGRSVWWRWTAPSAGSVTLDTRGSYYDTTLGVYTGDFVNQLARIGGNDDIDPGVVQASTVSFTSTPGTVYRIAVDGYNGHDDVPSDIDGADTAGITLNLNFTSTGPSVPIITTQPASLTVTAGGSASFSVAATSTPAATFQWSFNGTPIAGATSATYAIASTTTASAGNYNVVLTNPAGSVTSDIATLTVNASTPTPTPTPSPSGGGGGGGGGAPSLWFSMMLAALGLGRIWRSRVRT